MRAVYHVTLCIISCRGEKGFNEGKGTGVGREVV